MSVGLQKLLEATKPGEIVATIAEDDYGSRIVRLIDKQGESYNTEEISLGKALFDTWYRQQTEKITVQILDATLKQSIQSAYGNILWVKQLGVY